MDFDSVKVGVSVRREAPRAPFVDHAFDAAVTVGTTSQMPAESLRELVRVVRPSGRLLCAVWVEAYVEREYAEVQRSLEARHRLALVHRGEAFQGLPRSEPDIWYEVWVFDVQSGTAPTGRRSRHRRDS